jgi:hypothetical protein
MNIVVFTTSYFLIIISVVGYGLLFSDKFYIYKKKIDFGYAGLLGLFVLIIYSYLSSFFLAHNIAHNLLILFTGILIFIKKMIKNFQSNKKEYLLFFLIFLLLFFSAFGYKTNEDFPYYHFNYTMLLVENSSFLGIGILNHGFRTPSSLFYVNSLFYLPFIKFYSFHMAALLIMGFSNYILLKKIKDFNKEKINFIFYLSLLNFFFINVIFYRIAEHGTDRSAQILILILIIEILSITNFFNLKEYKKKFQNILVLIGVIISLKAFYILYLIFFFYVFLYLYNKVSFNKIIKENFLYISSLSLIIILILIINLQNSACFLYPLKFTCISNLPWAFSEQELNIMSVHYENWAKAGAGPGYKISINPEIYIQNFNWVGNWFKLYFAEKGINTLAGILSIAIITFCVFFVKKNTKKKKITYKTVFFIIFFLFIVWFLKHPDFRYGGFCLLATLIFLPVSLILDKSNSKIHIKKAMVLISITLFIFLARNITRINSEIIKYNYEPIKKTFYHVNLDQKENFFVPNEQIKYLINEFILCQNKNYSKNCAQTKNQIGLFLNKYYLKNYQK